MRVIQANHIPKSVQSGTPTGSAPEPAPRRYQRETQRAATSIPTNRSRLFYFNLNDWTWWLWTITTVFLFVGLAGYPQAYVATIVLTAAQSVYFIGRERSLSAFPVQLRLAYLALLGISYIPEMRWLFWWPALGTLALIVFGYCLLARVLSLLPWNSTESHSLDRLGRTFFTKPDPSRVSNPGGSACSGGLCTIEAQVRPTR